MPPFVSQACDQEHRLSCEQWLLSKLNWRAHRPEEPVKQMRAFPKLNWPPILELAALTVLDGVG